MGDIVPPSPLSANVRNSYRSPSSRIFSFESNCTVFDNRRIALVHDTNLNYLMYQIAYIPYGIQINFINHQSNLLMDKERYRRLAGQFLLINQTETSNV